MIHSDCELLYATAVCLVISLSNIVIVNCHLPLLLVLPSMCARVRVRVRVRTYACMHVCILQASFTTLESRFLPRAVLTWCVKLPLPELLCLDLEARHRLHFIVADELDADTSSSIVELGREDDDDQARALPPL